MESFSDIIEAWPTAADLGRDIGVKDVTARAWKHRGIPSEYWTAVVEAAEGRGILGVTIEKLAELAASRRSLGPAIEAA